MMTGNNLNLKDLKSILMVRTDNLGDLVLTLPAILALKKTLPSCAITMVINASNESLLRGLPYIDRVISVSLNMPKGILKSLMAIRKFSYDVAIHLLPGNNPCGSFLVAASVARYKVGYGIGFFSSFFNYRIHPGVLGYEVDNVMEIIKAVVPDLKFYGRGLEVSPQASAYIDKILSNLGIADSDRIIVIHPGASRIVQNKIWPPEKFAALIKSISSYIRAKFFLVGSAEDKPILKQLKERVPDTHDLSGMLSLAELAGLIKKSALFIANNSGPLQIAVALDIPTVSLMGPSLFHRWAPQGAKHIVISKQVDCIPCEGTPRLLKCKDNICMQMISVDEVFEAVRSQLGKQ